MTDWLYENLPVVICSLFAIIMAFAIGWGETHKSAAQRTCEAQGNYYIDVGHGKISDRKCLAEVKP